MLVSNEVELLNSCTDHPRPGPHSVGDELGCDLSCLTVLGRVRAQIEPSGDRGLACRAGDGLHLAEPALAPTVDDEHGNVCDTDLTTHPPGNLCGPCGPVGPCTGASEKSDGDKGSVLTLAPGSNNLSLIFLLVMVLFLRSLAVTCRRVVFAGDQFGGGGPAPVVKAMQ